MPNLVPHPETGLPSLEVVSHETVELSQLEGKVTENEATLGQSQAEVTRLQEELTKAQELVSANEVALADSKSLVEQYHAIAPTSEAGTPTPDAGTEGTSSDPENGPEAETPSEPVADGATSIPVTVEPAAPEPPAEPLF